MVLRKIRVLIADDHAMVRVGLKTMLCAFDELEFVGEATNGQMAIEMCDELLPDLVLMDVNMPIVDGVAATYAIHQKRSDIKILALTAHTQDGIVQKVLQAGAIGYVLKSSSPDELVNAIHSAIAGQVILSPEAVQSILQIRHIDQDAGFGFTEREHEVLQLMIDGLGNNAIAERLHVSPLTIKSHVSNILSKMSVATRAEAVALATRRGFLS